MSRIDEALRRAESGSATDGPAVAAVAEQPDASQAGLDRYAAERQAVRPVLRERPHAIVSQRPIDHERPSDVHIARHPKLVLDRDIEPASLEQYRRLASALEQMQAEAGLKCLMVTSALPREGKTLTVVNLALTLSESYKRRVLLVDADLRRPSVHEVLGVPNDSGLAELLRRPESPMKPIQVSATLSVLLAGRTHGSPIAGLSSDRMRGVLVDAVSRFDWVLVDTPPVGLLTDAQLVARLANGVLFVIGAGVTPCAVAQRSIAEIGAERIVGTVLNRVDPRALPVRHYYGRYYPDRS